MRDYQLAGLNWLIRLYENGINGILADEMVCDACPLEMCITLLMCVFVNASEYCCFVMCLFNLINFELI